MGASWHLCKGRVTKHNPEGREKKKKGRLTKSQKDWNIDVEKERR